MNTKMKYFCVAGILFALFFNPFYSFAQNKSYLINISGIVIDSLSGHSVDYLTVSLRDSGNTILQTEYTKDGGKFGFRNLAPSKFTIIITGVGYRSKILGAGLTGTAGKILDLGKIVMVNTNENLAEVNVTAVKPLIKQEIDRITYDLQSDPGSRVSSVLEMMRKVPMLTVDENDNIQMKGNSNYKILVNGKPSSMMERSAKEVLRSMPASTIQKIEVITTPPSKYDAEGIDGIINIITIKKLANGYSGTLTFYGTDPTGGPGVGGSLSVKQGKLGITAFSGGGIYNTPQTISTINRISSGGIVLAQSNTKKMESHSAYFGSELSYEIDSLNLVSASVNVNGSRANKDEDQSSFLNDQTSLLQEYALLNKDRSSGSGTDASVNYQLGFRKNKASLLTFSYRYYAYDNKVNSDIDLSGRFNYNLPDYKQFNAGSSTENTFQFDYITTIKKLSIETGIKGIFRQNASGFEYRSFNENTGVFEYDVNRTNEFSNIQNVYAAYMAYQLSLGDWVFKAGLRLEQTHIEAEFKSTETFVNQDQLNLVPSVALSRKLKHNRSINFGYSQRIQRPGIYQLNPFVDRSNPNVEISGNPDLHPVVGNAFQLGYSKQGKGFISLGVDYTFYNRLINQVATYNADANITRIAYQNTGQARLVGLNANLSYPITQEWSLSSNNKLFYGIVEGVDHGAEISTSGIGYSIGVNSGYKFNKGWRINASTNMRSRSFALQSKSNGSVSTSFSASKGLMKDKLTFSASMSNPFNKYRDSRKELTGQGFEQINEDRIYYRSYRLSLSWSFGKLKEAVTKNKRSIKNDDVSN